MQFIQRWMPSSQWWNVCEHGHHGHVTSPMFAIFCTKLQLIQRNGLKKTILLGRIGQNCKHDYVQCTFACDCKPPSSMIIHFARQERFFGFLKRHEESQGWAEILKSDLLDMEVWKIQHESWYIECSFFGVFCFNNWKAWRSRRKKTSSWQHKKGSHEVGKCRQVLLIHSSFAVQPRVARVAKNPKTPNLQPVRSFKRKLFVVFCGHFSRSKGHVHSHAAASPAWHIKIIQMIQWYITFILLYIFNQDVQASLSIKSPQSRSELSRSSVLFCEKANVWNSSAMEMVYAVHPSWRWKWICHKTFRRESESSHMYANFTTYYKYITIIYNNDVIRLSSWIFFTATNLWQLEVG